MRKSTLCMMLLVLLLVACAKSGGNDMVTESPAAISPTPTSLAPSQAPSVAPTVVTTSEPYIPPELTPVSAFDFGGYLLMVEERTISAGSENWDKPLNSLLGQDINSIEFGRNIFDQLSKKYYKEYPIITTDSFPRGIYTEEEYIDRFFRRKVEFVSPDGKRVLCSSFVTGGVDRYPAKWDMLYEVFEGNKKVFSYVYEGDSPSRSWDIIYGVLYPGLDGSFCYDRPNNQTTFSDFANNKEIVLGGSFRLNNSKTKQALIFQRGNDGEELIDVYSLETGELIASYSRDEGSVLQFTDDGKLLIWKDDPGVICLTNLDGSNEVYLGNYKFDPLISPDGKYLAYCGPTWEALTDYPEGSPIYDMPMGFYIKNLETGQTVFYPTEYTDYRILGWVEKVGLDELLGE